MKNHIIRSYFTFPVYKIDYWNIENVYWKIMFLGNISHSRYVNLVTGIYKMYIGKSYYFFIFHIPGLQNLLLEKYMLTGKSCFLFIFHIPGIENSAIGNAN